MNEKYIKLLTRNSSIKPEASDKAWQRKNLTFYKKWELGIYPGESIEGAKVIFIFGASGCGKSTFIDAFGNFLLGITPADPFRFTLTSEQRELKD